MNKDVKKLVEGKRVCLLGNAESILTSKKDIDSFDVVCRCNRGFPKGKEAFIGSRTDILFTSVNIAFTDYYDSDPMFVVWCTPKHDVISIDFRPEIDDYFSMKHWRDLYKEFGARPSTGVMAVYYLIKNTEFFHLTLFGFDFWKSKTWWQKRDKDCPHPHSEGSEETFIKRLAEENKDKDMEIVYG